MLITSFTHSGFGKNPVALLKSATRQVSSFAGWCPPDPAPRSRDCSALAWNCHGTRVRRRAARRSPALSGRGTTRRGTSASAGIRRFSATAPPVARMSASRIHCDNRRRPLASERHVPARNCQSPAARSERSVLAAISSNSYVPIQRGHQ